MWVILIALVDVDGNPATYSEFEHVLDLIILAGTVVLAIIAIFKVWQVVCAWGRKFNDFYEDWYGTPATDYEPRKPGVREMVHNLHNEVYTLKQALEFKEKSHE